MNIGKTDNKLSLREIISSSNPLPNDILHVLLENEESLWHDFKSTLDFRSNKELLDITKDIIGFANTEGGYLVIGIQNKTHKIIGLSRELVEQFSDMNILLGKTNRYIMPSIININLKTYTADDKNIVVLHVPCSKGKTHVVEKEGKFQNQEKKEITLLRKGEIFVRRAGATVIATHSDLEQLMDRRMMQFKEKISQNIARTIEVTDPNNVISISTEKANSSDTNIYRLSNSPDAIPVKGISSNIPPKNLEEVLVSSVAMYKFDKNCVLPANLIYNMYAERDSFSIPRKYLIYLVRFSIIKNAPTFYWLISCDKSEVIQLLQELSKNTDYFIRDYVHRLSYFVDKTLYTSIKRNRRPTGLGAEFNNAKKYNGMNFFITSVYLDKIKTFKGLVPYNKRDLKQMSEEATTFAIELVSNPEDKSKCNNLIAYDCWLFSKKIFTQLPLLN